MCTKQIWLSDPQNQWLISFILFHGTVRLISMHFALFESIFFGGTGCRMLLGRTVFSPYIRAQRVPLMWILASYFDPRSIHAIDVDPHGCSSSCEYLLDIIRLPPSARKGSPDTKNGIIPGGSLFPIACYAYSYSPTYRSRFDSVCPLASSGYSSLPALFSPPF
jgi:hypothetical protein